MRAPRSHWFALVAALALSGPGFGYYHFVHYLNRTSPFSPIQEKFDLNQLPNKTLTFYVVDSGPTKMAPNDSFASLLSEIKQATQVWNGVSTSDLRVAFGGVYAQGTQQNSPGAQVVFTDDLGPGLLALGGTVSQASQITTGNGTFVPIQQSFIQLNRDLTVKNGPSYLESFFNTLVHEMGHALGLQHSWASGAMSVEVTRATNRSKALEADDVAGISYLYPNGNYLSQFGSITGRVTAGGAGAQMVSVVAIRTNGGGTVSTITNPDGTYRIDGVPQDNYIVYAHPLPPAVQPGLGPGDIVWPKDPSGFAVTGTTVTDTQFYGGTKDPSRALPVFVGRANTTTGIDIALQRRAQPAIYDVKLYSYFGATAVHPAFVNVSQQVSTLVAGSESVGLISGTLAAPGFTMQILGGGVNNYSVRPYQASGQTYLALDLQVNSGATLGPRNVVFTTNNDIYVLPSAFTLVQKQPPSIATVVPNGDGTVTITGQNFSSDTRFFFDSIPAGIARQFVGNDQSGSVVVTPPPGASGQVATLVAYNPDGQNSLFVQGQNPPTFAYGPADNGSITLNPPSLPAGSTGMIELNGANTHWDSQTVFGFGSSDISVGRVFVTGPTRAYVNVSVAAGTPQQAYEVSAMAGFQMASQPLGFQVLPPATTKPSVSLILNGATGQPVLYPGAVTFVFGSNLSVGANTSVTLNDQPVQIQQANSGQISFVLPANTASGMAVLKINNGSDSSFPLALQIESVPLVLLSVNPRDGSGILQAGSQAIAVVAGLDGSVSPSRLKLIENGVELPASLIAPTGANPNQMQILFNLASGITGTVQMSISLDGGAPSNPITLNIR